ncbi:IPT/TIG domain-containing protein [Flavobacterium sp. SUN052]|uniref:IPT/TIG domain-containing protein n=1 Tax=Flavobacterium sp. SUN052 TaxID=3002441 RepID=UPI00237E5F43|nr:IPT/TIG domain-containing protein [Flavobacterium sp. SUN052]MEC4005470.1 IPT/TIG domain-containing protein [Flavobacterium sp. SUN052]
MKKNNFKNFGRLLLTLFISITLLSSCNNDDSSASNQQPVISSVSASVDQSGQAIALTPITIGYANNLYIIQGSGFSTTKKVLFNDTEASFNPNFVTDSSIFVTININTPYANASNKLKVITDYGVAEFDFTVAPPAPILQSYNSINAADGDTITIYGSFFLNPTVTFGTTPATVISSTLSEIQVVVPAGSNHKYVTVTTISGSSTSTQAIGTAIYDDDRASFVENYLGPWDGSGFTQNTDIKIQGASSIKAVFTGYTGFKFPIYATPVATAGYSGIRVSLKSTKDTGKFKLVINGNYGGGKEITFNSNWTSFVIPFSDLGYSGTSINEIVFQEYGNAGGDTLYLDDVGFVLQ